MDSVTKKSYAEKIGKVLSPSVKNVMIEMKNNIPRGYFPVIVPMPNIRVVEKRETIKGDIEFEEAKLRGYVLIVNGDTPAEYVLKRNSLYNGISIYPVITAINQNPGEILTEQDMILAFTKACKGTRSYKPVMVDASVNPSITFSCVDPRPHLASSSSIICLAKLKKTTKDHQNDRDKKGQAKDYAIVVKTYDETEVERIKGYIEKNKSTVEEIYNTNLPKLALVRSSENRGLIAKAIADVCGFEIKTEKRKISRLGETVLEIGVPEYETLFNVLHPVVANKDVHSGEKESRFAFYDQCSRVVSGKSPYNVIISKGVQEGFAIVSVPLPLNSDDPLGKSTVSPFPMGPIVKQTDDPVVISKRVIWGSFSEFHSKYNFEKADTSYLDEYKTKELLEILGCDFKLEAIEYETIVSYCSSHYPASVPLTKMIATAMNFNLDSVTVPPNHKAYLSLLNNYDTFSNILPLSVMIDLLKLGEDGNHHVTIENLKKLENFMKILEDKTKSG